MCRFPAAPPYSAPARIFPYRICSPAAYWTDPEYIYLTMRINLIHDLVQNAEEQFGNQFSLSGSKNEFDYLKSTYSNIINHQEELVTIFPLIYDSVAEKVFHDLFFDYETPSAELAGRLDMLSEKFRYYQRFRVVLAVPEHFSEEFNNRMPLLSQKISALPEALNKISICPKTDLGIIVVLAASARIIPSRKSAAARINSAGR